MPLRMRTPERRDTLLSAVCAVQKLQEAVDLVELEQEVPCYTLTHVNIHMLLSKLESLMEYAIREEIFDSLSSPEQVYILLQVMNHTLPAIAVHVDTMNETEWESYEFYGSFGSGESPSCDNDLCRNNCTICTANCGVHQLKTGVLDLIALLETDPNSPDLHEHSCTLCADERVRNERVELANKLEAIADVILSPTPDNYQCLPIVLQCPPRRCNRLLELQGWLETVTSWINESVLSLNSSHEFSNLRVVVERLSTLILPEIRKSLVPLVNKNCTDLGCDAELPSPTQIVQQVSSALSHWPYSDCSLEPLVKLRALNILRCNYSFFVKELLPYYYYPVF